MGIRFRCPNGHKLNVKEIDPATGKRVVGRVGYCPKCGVRFRIPAGGQALPEPSDSSVLDDQAPVTASPFEDSAALEPAAQPLAPQAAGNGQSAGASRRFATAQAPADVAVSSSPLAAPRWRALEEAPRAIWYVRPPTGGQYGPARSDVMRQWLLEGRVPEQALVWREGWPNWETAGAVFPGLSELFATPPAGSMHAGPVAGVPPLASTEPQPAASAAPLPAKQNRGRRTTRWPSLAPTPGRRTWNLVGVLAGLCLLLGAVLVYLLFGLQ